MDTHRVKLLRLQAVIERVAYKSSSIYQKIKDDKFPKPRIKRRGFTAWFEEDIDLYLLYLGKEDSGLKWSEFVKMIPRENEQNDISK